MVDDFRWKWYEDLEEIVRCPVCFGKPKGEIRMCTQGHHVCLACRNMLAACPLCKMTFSTCRNYLAEHLIEIMKELKTLQTKKNNVIPMTLTVGVQTEPLRGAVPKLRSFAGPKVKPKVNDRNDDKSSLKSEPVKRPEPLYNCRVGDCSVQVPRQKMMGHIHEFHKSRLYTTTAKEIGNELVCDYTWLLSMYAVPLSVTCVLNIHRMGIFFLQLITDQIGCFKGYLQSNNNPFFSEKFSYQLELKNADNSFKYEGRAQSCRFSTEQVHSYLSVGRIDMKNILQKKNTTHCNITIRCSSTKSPRPEAAETPMKSRTAKASSVPSRTERPENVNINVTSTLREKRDYFLDPLDFYD